MLCEVNDAQSYLQTEGRNVHQCSQKISTLQTVLDEKREEFVVEDLSYAKTLCADHPMRIRRTHFSRDGSRDAGLSHEEDLKRKIFSSLDRVLKF